MLKSLGRNNRLLLIAFLLWSLSAGLWFNQRPIYLSQLGATPEQIGSVLAMESFIMVFILISMGFFTDRFGPKRVIIGAWIIGVLGLLLMALAQTWQAAIPGLIIYRMAAGSSPAIFCYALANDPKQGSSNSSARSMTIIASAWPAGQVVAPTIGGVIAENASIRLDLCIATVLFMIAIGVFWRADPLRTQVVCSQEKGPVRQLKPALLKNRNFILLAAYFAVAKVSLYVGQMLIPNFLHDVRGLSLGTIGFLFSVSSLGGMFFNYLGGRIGLKWGYAFALAGPWLALAGLWQLENQGWTVIAFFLLGGIMSTWALMSLGIKNVVREVNQGQAFGILESITFAASAIAAWTGGQLYVLTTAHDLPLVAGFTSIPLMLVLWFWLHYRWRPRKHRVTSGA